MYKLAVPTLLVAMGVSACPPKPTPTPPPTPDATDAAIDDGGADDVVAVDAPVDVTVLEACTLAEKNLLRLQCKDSHGRLLGGANAHGQPFAKTCADAIEKRVDVHPICIAQAKTCLEVSSCSL